MSAKLDKIGVERDKAFAKRELWDARYKDLDQRYKKQENLEIQELVHSVGLTPDALGEFLKQLNLMPVPGGEVPAMTDTTTEGNAEAMEEHYDEEND